VNGGRIRDLVDRGRYDVVNFHNVSLIGGPGLLRCGGDAVTLYMAHEHWLVCPTHVLWRHGRELCTGRECIRCSISYRRPPQLWRQTGVLEREIARLDAVIAMSQFSRAKHREFGFARDMEVLPYFLPDPETPTAPRAQGPSPHPRPYFFFVGRLERIKGLDDVIPVFRDFPGADLLIAATASWSAAQPQTMPNDVFWVGSRLTTRYYQHALPSCHRSASRPSASSSSSRSARDYRSGAPVGPLSRDRRGPGGELFRPGRAAPPCAASTGGGIGRCRVRAMRVRIDGPSSRHSAVSRHRPARRGAPCEYPRPGRTSTAGGRVKVLITGGCGFIGSHLAERLLDRGDRVQVLDDLSTGSMENIEHLVGREGFAYRIGSALDVPLVAELVDSADVTVHLAAAVGVERIVEKPVHTIETNVRATEVVLGAAARKKKLVVVASTSEVYGKSTSIPFREDQDLQLGPTSHSRWAYACSKALDEWLALAYLREKGVPVIVTRFFNTVGPRQTGQYGMVLPNFAAQAVRHEPITVYGSGEQSRCATLRRCEGLLRSWRRCSGRRVFNIGATHEISIRALAEQVRTAADSRSDIVLLPYGEVYAAGFEDMMRRVPDVSKLQRVTGFRPQTSLEVIIRDVVEDQRTRLAAAAGSTHLASART
jgi:UDP-glucose 4-epimerase